MCRSRQNVLVYLMYLIPESLKVLRVRTINGNFSELTIEVLSYSVVLERSQDSKITFPWPMFINEGPMFYK